MQWPIPQSLADGSQGRRNRLNAIRLVAAFAVLFSHSFPIATGRSDSEPWLATLGTTPGGIAVDVFFTISGFLVTASLLRDGRIGRYAMARALRIYPGLWVALLLTVVAIGCCFTSLTPREFFGSRETALYLLKNGVMITGAAANLPGAFADNPAVGVINGSLWTLRWELRLYAGLALLWWLAGVGSGKGEAAGGGADAPRSASVGARPAARARGRSREARLGAALAILSVLALSRAADLTLHPHGDADITWRVVGMFLAGATAHVFRDRIRLDLRWGGAAVVICVGAALLSPLAFRLVYLLAMPYLVLCAAFFRCAREADPGHSDWSYGIYIYAFPVQQALVAWHPGIGPWALCAGAAAVTFALAWMSWRWVEGPALRWKGRR